MAHGESLRLRLLERPKYESIAKYPAKTRKQKRSLPKGIGKKTAAARELVKVSHWNQMPTGQWLQLYRDKKQGVSE